MLWPSRKPHILVACQPKSGSTFLSVAIGSLPGFRLVDLAPGDRREQELCESSLRRHEWRAYAAHHHVRFSAPTADIIARHRLHVVVLVRNLFDVVVSIRDHIRRESPIAPWAFFTPQHAGLPDHELEKAITRLAIPWYVNFYMGWREYPAALLVRYEEMVKSPVDTLRTITAKAGLSFSDSVLDQAIARALNGNARFNVGIAGRGAALAEILKQEIVALLDFYPAAWDDPYIRDMREPQEPRLHAIRCDL